jgi:hypothetical protein
MFTDETFDRFASSDTEKYMDDYVHPTKRKKRECRQVMQL